MIGALRRKMAAGHPSRRSPALLRLPWTPATVEIMVPTTCASTSSPLECGSRAVARPPPPSVAGVGLHATSLDPVREMPEHAAATIGLHAPDPRSSMAVALLSPPPAAAGVAPNPSMVVPLTPPLPAHASMGVPLPPLPRAAATVGLHATDPHSFVAVPLLSPPPAAAGVGVHTTNPDSSMATRPPPAAAGVGVHTTDPDSSMATPPPPPAASAACVGLLPAGNHSAAKAKAFRLRSTLTEMVVPVPEACSFTPSPPQLGYPAAAAWPPSAAGGVGLLNPYRHSSKRPLVKVDQSSSYLSPMPKYGRCGDNKNFMMSSYLGRLRNNILTLRPASIIRQLRYYSRKPEIPIIAYTDDIPPPSLATSAEFLCAPPVDDEPASYAKRVSHAPPSFDLITFCKVLDRDKDAAEKYSGVDKLKMMYDESSVREALVVRGLLWPHALENDPKTRCLHFEHERILGEGNLRYTTIKTFMKELIGLPSEIQKSVFNFLSKTRTIVYLDWDTELKPSISFALYDYSVKCIPFDADWYRSESDASWKDGKASITALIWKDTSLLWYEAYTDMDATTSVVAEGFGAYLQMKRGIGLDYQEFRTDCDTIFKVMNGRLSVEPSRGEYKLYRLLKVMTGYYKRIVPRLVPRKELSFVDGMMRNEQLMKYVGEVQAGSPEEGSRFSVLDVFSSWSPQLKGEPFLDFKQDKSCQLGKFKEKDMNQMIPYEKECFVITQEEFKFDAIWHIISALSPSHATVLTDGKKWSDDDFCEKLTKRFGPLQICVEKDDQPSSTFKMVLDPRFRKGIKTKELIMCLTSQFAKRLTQVKTPLLLFLGQTGIKLV